MLVWLGFERMVYNVEHMQSLYIFFCVGNFKSINIMTKKQWNNKHLNQRVMMKTWHVVDGKAEDIIMIGYITKINSNHSQIMIWFDGQEKPSGWYGRTQIEALADV